MYKTCIAGTWKADDAAYQKKMWFAHVYYYPGQKTWDSHAPAGTGT